ncbi:MAG TPA: hypothetical protein VEZ11_07355 [Thermoanaerobaculia bacterium]|nr:hypothetical protein [Thermoanaerobaculia bacterium]
MEDIVTTFTSFRYFRCSNCNARFRLRKPRGTPTPEVTRKARMKRMLRYVQILVIIIVIIVAIVFLIMPYMSIPRPVARPH